MAKMSVDELRDVASSASSGSGPGISLGALGVIFAGVFATVLAGGLGWSAVKDAFARPGVPDAPQVARVVADPSPSFDVTGGRCFREAKDAMRRQLKKTPAMQMRMMVGNLQGGFGSKVEVEADTITCAAKAVGSFCDKNFRREFALYVKDFQRGLTQGGNAQLSLAAAMNPNMREQLNRVRSKFNADAVGRVRGTVASLMDRGLLRPDDFGGLLVPVPDWATALAPQTIPQRAC